MLKLETKENILLKISAYNSIPNYGKYNRKQMQTKSAQHFRASDISDILAKGDKALNENRFQEALDAYTKANQTDPNNNSVYKKLGKTYFHLKDYKASEMHFKTYLENAPEDAECWIDLGQTQKMAGYYQKAIDSFKQASKMDSSNDYAKRCMLETQNDMLAIYFPQQAEQEKREYAAKNLQAALNMTIDYLSPAYMKDLADVKVMFGETASMGGTANIAQYENYKKTITISKDYIYASPQVIAAYLTHESVHAKDADAYTSIREEQDAYEIATKYWINHSNGIKDPEMDYAAGLYTQSPSALRNRVAEIYKLRDPSIAETSPNHPPDKSFHFLNKKSHAASHPIKEYNVIA